MSFATAESRQNVTMSHIGERIAARRNKLGWSKTKVATLAEMDRGHYTRIENGTSGYSTDTLQRIACALQVSVAALHAHAGNIVDAPPPVRHVPLLDYVQAGQWTAVRDTQMEDEIVETVAVHIETPPSSFGMRIRGDSMQPRFHEGDIVIISSIEAPKPKNFVVAVNEDGEASFKQYRELGKNAKGIMDFELVPLNSFHPTWRSDKERLRIVGVMVAHYSYQRT